MTHWFRNNKKRFMMPVPNFKHLNIYKYFILLFLYFGFDLTIIDKHKNDPLVKVINLPKMN